MRNRWVIPILLLVVTPAVAQFFPARQFPAARSPMIADIDQDGIADIVTLDDRTTLGAIHTLLGVGDGTFVAGPKSFVLDDPIDSVAGDFDRDGIVDLASGDSSGGLKVCPGIGGGRFGSCTEYDTGFGAGPRSLLTGDFDDDGALDLAGVGGGDVKMLLNNRVGGFNPAVTYQTPYGSRALALGDFDGDGALDLATANYSVRSASVLMGIGDGTFAPRLDIQLDHGTPYDVAVGDFDDDGWVDLVVTHERVVTKTGNISVHGMSDDVAVGEFDSDGLLDPVENHERSTYTTGGISVALGHGNGTFSRPVTYIVGRRSSDVVVDDFNADGLQDVIVGERYGNSVWLLGSNGDGTFAAPVPVESGQGSFGVVVGDLDGRHGPDLVTSGSHYDEKFVTVLLSDGPAGFSTRTDYPEYYRPSPPAVADFDSDGVPDLVYSFRDIDAISLLRGNGDGSFVPSGLSPTGDRPGTVAVGDIDGDGMVDVVTPHSRSSELMVLLGDGDGSFGPGKAYRVGSGPGGLVIADLDRDGRDDVVSVNYGDDRIGVFLAQPGGSLAAEVTYWVQNEPRSAAAADFDGDDILDLAVIDKSLNGSVTILRGVGDGRFASLGAISTGASYGLLAIGDLNEDGKQDLVIPSGIPNSGLALLFGRGDATFEAKVFLDVDGIGSGIGLYDVDRDSHLDVIVEGWYGQLHVLLGGGDGTLSEQTSYAFPVDHFVVSDLDGDGMADLAGSLANVNGAWENAVSVLIGLKAPPAVTIDIRPKRIKPGSKGVIPVVIFGSEGFDVQTLDVTTIGFGPNGAPPAHDLSNPEVYADHLEDMNDDGYVDLMVHFRANQSGIGCGATSATLVGATFDGRWLHGSDTISTVACHSPRRPAELRQGGRAGRGVLGEEITNPTRR